MTNRGRDKASGACCSPLAESFANEHGARRIESSVAPDAMGFYSKCGYDARNSRAEHLDTHMIKDLA